YIEYSCCLILPRLYSPSLLLSLRLPPSSTRFPYTRSSDLKRRPDKPFAVMVADLAAASALCQLTPADEQLLSAPQRPVVLLPRRPGTAVADAVAPGTGRLGLMLPYTPLHHLLLAEV